MIIKSPSTPFQIKIKEAVSFLTTKFAIITCASSEARHKFRFAPCFFLNLCRGLQPLSVILDILDSGYIRLFDITEKPSLAYTVRTQ